MVEDFKADQSCMIDRIQEKMSNFMEELDRKMKVMNEKMRPTPTHQPEPTPSTQNGAGDNSAHHDESTTFVADMSIDNAGPTEDPNAPSGSLEASIWENIGRIYGEGFNDSEGEKTKTISNARLITQAALTIYDINRIEIGRLKSGKLPFTGQVFEITRIANEKELLEKVATDSTETFAAFMNAWDKEKEFNLQPSNFNSAFKYLDSCKQHCSIREIMDAQTIIEVPALWDYC